VREDADRFNPLVWVPLEDGAEVVPLPTGTQLNADPWPLAAGSGGRTFLLFTAQGGSETREKRWRRIYLARLQSEEIR
jgi:hypothetical protein